MDKATARRNARRHAANLIATHIDQGWPCDQYATEDDALAVVAELEAIVTNLRRPPRSGSRR